MAQLRLLASANPDMPSRRVLARALAMLHASPLPRTDRVRLELEREVLAKLAKLAQKERPPCINVGFVGQA